MQGDPAQPGEPPRIPLDEDVVRVASEEGGNMRLAISNALVAVK